MNLLLLTILVSYLLVCAATFSFLFKLKSLISYHLGMNIAMTTSGVMGIAIGTVLGFAFPAHYTLITDLYYCISDINWRYFWCISGLSNFAFWCFKWDYGWNNGTNDWCSC